jgi:deoxyribonuclease IV
MFRFGCHVSKSQIEEVQRLGGNLVQVFLTTPMSSKATPKDGSLQQLREELERRGMALVVHAPYTLNLARRLAQGADPKDAAWVKACLEQLRGASRAGALGLVVHVGKSLDQPVGDALRHTSMCLRYLVRKIVDEDLGVLLLLETAAGQGTEVPVKLDELAAFYNTFSDREKRVLKICVDTCHVFSSGHDIRTASQVDAFFKRFHEEIGIHNLALIHLNDSKRELGARVDRHERIGMGKIGKAGLKRFVQYAKKLNIPLILETPDEGYKQEIPWIAKLAKHHRR